MIIQAYRVESHRIPLLEAEGLLCFPQKNGHEKRLDLLSHFGLFGKQKIISFSCW
jgi:hypothetical protein